MFQVIQDEVNAIHILDNKNNLYFLCMDKREMWIKTYNVIATFKKFKSAYAYVFKMKYGVYCYPLVGKVKRKIEKSKKLNIKKRFILSKQDSKLFRKSLKDLKKQYKNKSIRIFK